MLDRFGPGTTVGMWRHRRPVLPYDPHVEQSTLTDDTLRALALGGDPHAARQACIDAEQLVGSPARSLAALAAFWDGDFPTAHDDAHCALVGAASADRPLALAVTALALGGQPGVWRPGSEAIFDELRTMVGDTSRVGHLTRYVAAEAALACARIDDAATLLAGQPPTAVAWADHPIAVVMQANAVRIAAFAGHISDATAMLPALHAAVASTAPTGRLAALSRSVDDLVRGNAVGAVVEDVQHLPLAPTDYLDRGACLLTAYGAIATGDTGTAAALVLRAGGDAGLRRVPIIDRALGLELLTVAALADDDHDAVLAWEGEAATLADHPVARPTIDRLRSRVALSVGEVAEAVRLAERSVEACREHSRFVEAAESEVVLARAHIADHHVSEATRRLRAQVLQSDATGHAAVRQSAARTLGTARRRLPPLAHGGWEALSAREREVGHLVLAGRDIVQIARELHLSPHTVRGHVSRVLSAFGVATRVSLLDAVGEVAPDPRAASLPPLTARQGDVAELVAAGRTNQQVAEALGISIKAVEKHVGDAMRRWDVLTRFELARLFRAR